MEEKISIFILVIVVIIASFLFSSLALWIAACITPVLTFSWLGAFVIWIITIILNFFIQIICSAISLIGQKY